MAAKRLPAPPPAWRAAPVAQRPAAPLPAGTVQPFAAGPGRAARPAVAPPPTRFAPAPATVQRAASPAAAPSVAPSASRHVPPPTAFAPRARAAQPAQAGRASGPAAPAHRPPPTRYGAAQVQPFSSPVPGAAARPRPAVPPTRYGAPGGTVQRAAAGPAPHPGMPGTHPRVSVPPHPPGAVIQPFPGALWLAAGGVLGAAAVATSSLVLGSVAAAAAAKGAYDWWNAPTREMIPDVPAHYTSDDAGSARYTIKGPDRRITGVQVTVRTARQGAMRGYYAMDTDSSYRRTGIDGIDVDARYEREIVHRASEVMVADIRVPRGRRQTRYEPDQGDHTVAWTLMTLSLERLAGRNVHSVMNEIIRMAREEWSHPGQNPDAREVLRPLMYFDPQLLLRGMPAADWQRIVAEAIDRFLSANQLASHTTFKRNGRKTTAIKKEDTGLEIMMWAEDELSQGYGHSESTARLADAAEALLDVQFNPSLGARNYAQAVANWIRALNRAFPSVMGHPTAGPAIRNRVLNRPVPGGSQPALGVNTVSLLLAHHGLPTS